MMSTIEKALEANRNYSLIVAFVCAAVSLNGCAPRARTARYSSAGLPPDSVVIAHTESVASRAVAIGDAEGIVVDAFSGAPIYGARVIVINSKASERPLYSLANRDGYFHLTHLPGRSVKIVASRGDYYADTLTLEGKSGHSIRFGLHAMRMLACGLVVITDSIAMDSAARHQPANAITVSVRDARTDSWPTSPVTLRVRDGAYSDSATSTSANLWNAAIVIGVARARDGVYDVDVTASGYQPWHLRHVHPVVDNCREVVGRTFEVRLLPL